MIRGSEAEAVAFGEPGRHANAQSAQRAKSLTSDFPLPPAPTLLPVTNRDAIGRADQALARMRDGLEWLASGSHLTARPPSMREAHAHVHDVASRYEALALKVPRIVWGYGHLTLKALLHLIEWVTKSPVTFACAAVLITLAVFFL